MKKILKIFNSEFIIKILFIILGIIGLGLISRKIDLIPFFIGDILWAIMIFYIIVFMTNFKLKLIAIISLTICFGIEFSQLINLELLNSIRSNTFGKLIFGQGFLYSDLLCYFCGITLAYFINKKTIKLSP